MSLKLSKELSSGVSGDFWKIMETNINYIERRSHVTIALYKDEEAKLTNKSILYAIAYDWNDQEFPYNIHRVETTNPITGEKTINTNLEDSDPLAIAYQKIKILPEFEGSIDC